ncbi:MAG: hypothetical protein HY234_14530 [Acidobacteria bacterium]|nr:hypothetical protein [Acidobacteriota bacterium]
MKAALRISCLIGLFILIGSMPCLAQVATGTPPFGSFSGSANDVVNNANLNVHIAVPVISKPGRGMNFTSNLGNNILG